MIRAQKLQYVAALQEREARRLKLAASSDLLTFIREFSTEPPPAAHHLVLIDRLQKVADGAIKRLMIVMSPGAGKSTYTSMLFTPWWIARNPGKLIAGVSHGTELAERFSRRVRDIVGAVEYTDLFDVGLSADSKAARRWETTSKAEYYAVGTGGSITGRRCFPAGTLISTPTGDVPIELMGAGDELDSYSHVENCCTASKIIATREMQYDGDIIELHTADGSILRTTPDHRIYTQGEYRAAQDIRIGDSCVRPQKSTLQTSAFIEVRRISGASLKVYDLHVEATSNYFAEKVLVHNCDLGLIDDPVKGREDADSPGAMAKLWEWYKSDFRTRLKPAAALIIIGTRWSASDLSSHILPEDYAGQSGDVVSKDGEIWHVLNLPMEAGIDDVMGRKPGELLWPEWFFPDWVALEKKIQGARNWSALYNGNPVPDEGLLFKLSDFNHYRKPPKNLRYYLTGDYAVTADGGDYTVLCVWGVDVADQIYLIDGFRGQVDSLGVIDALMELIDRYKPIASVAESGVIRRALEPLIIKTMRARKVFTTLEWLPTAGDKTAMVRGFQAQVQAGAILLPTTEFGESVLRELVKFPAGKFDDAVDACGLLGRYMDNIWRATRKRPGPGTQVLPPSTMRLPPALMTDFIGEFNVEY